MLLPVAIATPRSLSALAIAALVACSCGSSVSRRAGPDFRLAFADYNELLTTTDPERLRVTLADVKLPRDREHHDRLLELARRNDRIDAAHLILLVESVWAPEDSGTLTNDGTHVRFYPVRGSGEFAHVVDEILNECATKLVNLDRRWLGELIGRTQSDATMHALAERLVPPLDDGSQQAVDEILHGMSSSPALSPFLVHYMAPAGRLDGKRGWDTAGRLPFDDSKVTLLETLAARTQSIDVARLEGIVGSMRFDGGRAKALRILLPLTAGFDAASANAVVGHFAFDSGRVEAVETLAARQGFRIDGAAASALVTKCAFDDGRGQCLRALQPVITEFGGDDAVALLRSFGFDSGRLQAVRIMADRWRELPAPQVERMLEAFAFDSERKEARALLR